MAKDFAFRPDPPTKAQLASELRGHEMAKEGMSSGRFAEITNAVDKVTGRYDDLPDRHRVSGFEKTRHLQYVQAKLNRRRLQNG